jgi:hypothetical protein
MRVHLQQFNFLGLEPLIKRYRDGLCQFGGVSCYRQKHNALRAVAPCHFRFPYWQSSSRWHSITITGTGFTGATAGVTVNDLLPQAIVVVEIQRQLPLLGAGQGQPLALKETLL